jgi:hypothetical protein
VNTPDLVRRNLGITFARVELRPVAQTLRAPGQFELQPEARREYRTMLDGRVELLVRQFEAIQPALPLFRLASPQWRDLQEKLNDAEAAVRRAQARSASIPGLLTAHEGHEESLRSSVTMWEERVRQLEATRASGVVSGLEFAAAFSSLADARTQLAEAMEKHAELMAQSVEVETELYASRAKLRLLLATASTVAGFDMQALMTSCDPATAMLDDGHRHEGPAGEAAPFWREISEIEVKAETHGVVDSLPLTNGAWATAGTLVVSSIDPTQLRFRATGMQSDLGRLRAGLQARIVPPKGGTIDRGDAMDADLTLGWSAEARERTLELIAVPRRLASWARPGVSAHLEVITDGGRPELAIPLASVIQDGLNKVIFRRDPKDPDQVIRLEADLGVTDGRWIVVYSGLREGDEVVEDGVYQLMIATSGTAETGGHFHSDGTFHAGDDH